MLNRHGEEMKFVKCVCGYTVQCDRKGEPPARCPACSRAIEK